ncbi:OmpH family outer membrane protein [Salibaculum griseiflavum]|nr:OmpH family outer membrane protein [Salibaculum griseiflavum]
MAGPGLRLWHFLVLALLLPGTMLSAQDETNGLPLTGGDFPVAAADTPILTVDLERLFQQTVFGQAVVEDYNAERRALAAENREIAEALRTEELDLAERRPDMDPAVFREEAQAFDEKAQGIRRAQDSKEAAIEDDLARAQEEFVQVVQPVLGEILVDRGASVILHQQSVLLSLDRIDVTDEAIARVDEEIGDGAGLRQQ